MLRIGHGFDTHAFEEGRPLILGGVSVPHPRGMRAHSDGDVIIHAICDALLGAAALGDIGQHFPDTNKAYQNMDSRLFLKRIAQLLTDNHFKIHNIDATILAQAPKLMTYIPEMRSNIASDLVLDLKRVSIKATTTEKMGFVGKEEGIACYAVTLLSEELSQ